MELGRILTRSLLQNWRIRLDCRKGLVQRKKMKPRIQELSNFLFIQPSIFGIRP
jgi:hypothetical protein